MKKYVKAVLPNSTEWVAFLALPTVFTIYFLVSRYSNQFIQSQGIDYVAIQNNFLAQLFITGKLANFVTRFMDFAFWGVIASIGVLIAWGIGAARVTVENHSVQSGFSNFTTSQSDWKKGLIVVSVIKVLLVAVMIYSAVSLFVFAVPRLATGVALCVQALNPTNVLKACIGFLYIVTLQALFVACIRMFKITRAD
jgi:hypothetical protein